MTPRWFECCLKLREQGHFKVIFVRIDVIVCEDSILKTTTPTHSSNTPSRFSTEIETEVANNSVYRNTFPSLFWFSMMHLLFSLNCRTYFCLSQNLPSV